MSKASDCVIDIRLAPSDIVEMSTISSTAPGGVATSMVISNKSSVQLRVVLWGPAPPPVSGPSGCSWPSDDESNDAFIGAESYGEYSRLPSWFEPKDGVPDNRPGVNKALAKRGEEEIDDRVLGSELCGRSGGAQR